MGNIERSEPEHKPRAGWMHPVDKAFYDLAIKERNFERVKVDRLEAQLAGAVDALKEIGLPEHDRGRTPRRVALEALRAMGVHPSTTGGQ